MRNCGVKNLLEISVKEKSSSTNSSFDSSANVQLSKRFRSFHNWILMLVKQHASLGDNFIDAANKMKNFSRKSTNFSQNFLLLTKSEIREENTNEICFYTYDHLLDIFLNIRVSRDMNKLQKPCFIIKLIKMSILATIHASRCFLQKGYEKTRRRTTLTF